jgi:fatty-acid desaturase
VTTARLLAKRPHQIVQAIALLCISTTLGFFSSFSENDESWATLILAALVMLAVTVVLGVGLWRGRNWGRVAYLILVALSFAQFLSAWGVTETPALEVALEAVSFVADAGSFFLVFTAPGALWFQREPQPQV